MRDASPFHPGPSSVSSSMPFSSAVHTAVCSFPDIFIQQCHFLRQSGHSEKAVSLFQAMMDFTFYKPDSVLKLSTKQQVFDLFLNFLIFLFSSFVEGSDISDSLKVRKDIKITVTNKTVTKKIYKTTQSLSEI